MEEIERECAHRVGKLSERSATQMIVKLLRYKQKIPPTTKKWRLLRPNHDENEQVVASVAVPVFVQSQLPVKLYSMFWSYVEWRWSFVG